MGIDTTPASNDGDSEGRDSAPRWVLVLVVILVVVAAWWVLSAVFGVGSSARRPVGRRYFDDADLLRRATLHRR